MCPAGDSACRDITRHDAPRRDGAQVGATVRTAVDSVGDRPSRSPSGLLMRSSAPYEPVVARHATDRVLRDAFVRARAHVDNVAGVAGRECDESPRKSS